MKADGTDKKIHSLIDKVYHRTNLELAWKLVKQNGGSGGIDKVRIADFERMADEELDRLHQQLKRDVYKPMPVRRVNIPKRNKPTETRPLGIPTVNSYCMPPNKVLEFED